jgi:hypothetical protein
MRVGEVSKRICDYSFQSFPHCAQKGDWPVCLGLGVVVFALFTQHDRDRVFEVFRAVAHPQACIEEFVEAWQ